MKTMFAVMGLVLVAMSGVAHADGPGGWDQFNAMMAKQKQMAAAQQQPVVAQQAPNVEMFPATSRSGGTWLNPPNVNQGGN